MSTLTLDIPSSWWMSANDRMHWREKAARTRWVRDYAAIIARQEQTPAHDTALVYAFVQYPRAVRVDPANSFPTIKAAVDGLVDAGVFPDDDDQHVLGPVPLREPGKSPKGYYRVRFLILDQEVPW